MTAAVLVGTFLLALGVLVLRRRARAAVASATEGPRVYDIDAPCFTRDPITGARDRMGF